MQIGEKIRKANRKKKKLRVGAGFCPSRSVCLFAEAALSRAGMEKKGIPPAVRAAHMIGGHEQGTSLHLSYVPRVHITDWPGYNTLKEKKRRYFETILRALEYRQFTQTLDKALIPWQLLTGKSSLCHSP